MEDFINKSEFYDWAYSDLLVNNQRGHLAEYIVAKALEITNNKRLEWDPYDLLYKNCKIEIKSCAYIQAWEQNTFSYITFDIKPTRLFDYKLNCYQDEYKRQSDIYVFCLLKHKDKKTINPLDVNQWDFFIVPTKILNEKLGEQKKVSLSKLSKMNINPVQYRNIKQKTEEYMKQI